MNKYKVYETAKQKSINYTHLTIYVWENDFGEWFYGTEFPDQYTSIIAKLFNGVDILE